MRSFAFILACECALVVACDSFGEADPGSAANDAATPDAIADGGARPTTDAEPFCNAHADSGSFCFDFDTAPVAPTWILSQATPEGGTASIVVDDVASSSPPRSVFCSIDRPSGDPGLSSAALARSVAQTMTGAEFDFDVSVEQATKATSLFIVILSDASGLATKCSFGINATSARDALLFALPAVDGGAAVLSEPRTDAFSTAFTHVSFKWTTVPPEIHATIGTAKLGPLSVPDCVGATRAALAFGVQSPSAPVTSRARFDSIRYRFSE